MNADKNKQPELPELPYERLLGTKEVGAALGVSEDAVLNWWHCGLPTGKEIPARFMRRRGFRDYLFHPAVIDFIRAEQSQIC